MLGHCTVTPKPTPDKLTGMAFPTVEELAQLIAPAVEPRGLDIEEIKVTRAGKKSVVAIRLDADERPTLDGLEEVANDVSELFDAAETSGSANFGAGYTLEVSTPGVDMPLSAPRHWRRNRDRLVKVDGTKVWRIGALSDDESSVILVAHGKKKLGGDDVVDKRLSDVDSAVVEIEFNNPPAAETELSGLSYAEATQWREDNK